ncbi:MAG TPA: hypothetical protein VFF31_23650 [Blastocatellia bacterium]|nr:hypothetical protein [Blastocatellia bacterium]
MPSSEEVTRLWRKDWLLREISREEKMKPERWQQIENLCHRALEIEPRERARLLDEAFAGDRRLYGSLRLDAPGESTSH